MKYSLPLLVAFALLAAGCSSPPIVREVHSATEFSLQGGRRYRLAGLAQLDADHPLAALCRERAAKLLLDRRVDLVEDPAAEGEPPAVFCYTPIDVGEGQRRFLFVNAELALFGFARTSPPPANTPHASHYASLGQMEAVARRAKAGLWGDGDQGSNERGEP